MRVEFADVRKIPIASVLHHYKIPFRKRSDTELVCDCPLPSHAESSHKGTFAISTEKGKFYCHSDKCRAASNKPKGGDIIDFVCMMENCLPLDAAKRIKEMFCVPSELHNPPSKPLSNNAAHVELDRGLSTNPPLAFELKNLDPTHPFILGRGITAETAKEFGVGFHSGKGSMAGRICFPLHEDGSLIGYCGRTILDVTPENPKWRLPMGLHKTFLYGLERCLVERPLVLVEGTWACLWLRQQGIQAAALLGKTMTPEQEARLEPYAEIRVALDFDEAGIQAAEKIVAQLKPSHKVSKAFLRK